MKKPGEETKLSFGFIQLLMFLLPFLLLVNAEIGWIVLYAVAAAHIISGVLFLISVRHIEAEIQPEFLGVHAKGEKCTVNVTLRKTGFCILPEINLALLLVNSDELKTAKTALIGSKSVTVSYECSFIECGLNTAACIGWTATDAMGFITKSIAQRAAATVAILPEVKPYDGAALTPKLIPDEDDEEQEETVQSALNGNAPGFEYRAYQPGDSPRKINYKLSAKRHEILVRRDESTISGTTRILIKSSSFGDSAETAYSMASEIVSRGGAAEIFYNDESYRAASPATLGKLREWLAFREFPAISAENADDISDSMDYIICPSSEEQSGCR